ncbi:DAK2 domain-containing protein [Kocuria sp. JC486]|uniref:dihydroxyacetone kinase family protein n=1 Tax=Kocuria sp. JC486 TaxID=1970736 RepID=UPI0014207C3B|nr:DAK2 domain-containing protein [Kocuria sp. JC486]
MRKLINDPEDVIEDLITGLTTRNRALTRVRDWPVVVRAGGTGTTAVISGGGSGHEPAHAGFVGQGMLDAAVCGPVFTSPSVDAVEAAIEAVGPDRDVLLVVKNYTGDCLNFGLAAQNARARGRTVEQVVVADDVALADSAGAGRRGIAGTVLVHKLAGAMAEQGASAREIRQEVEAFLPGMGSMGIALGAALAPGAEQTNFTLEDHEVEWGLGIHGEPGRERGSAESARHVAESLVSAIVRDRELTADDDVVVLVNGLGATPPMELEILAGEVLTAVRAHGLHPALALVGSLLTSLDMPGASVTLAKVTDSQVAQLTAATEAPAWVLPTVPADIAAVDVTVESPLKVLGNGRTSPTLLAATDRAVDAVLDAESQLTDLDRQVGDGDLGTNLARGARAVRDHREQLSTAPDARTYFLALAHILRKEVGGTSGPLYALMALGLADAVAEGVEDPDRGTLAQGLQTAVGRIQELGGAQLGDGTMLDALIPAAQALADGEADDVVVLRAARDGAQATAEGAASKGRASYVGQRSVGVPDPGAVAVTVWLAAVLGQPQAV